MEESANQEPIAYQGDVCATSRCRPAQSEAVTSSTLNDFSFVFSDVTYALLVEFSSSEVEIIQTRLSTPKLVELPQVPTKCVQSHR